MAKYNILSSCICRDGFGFREDNKHEIVTFLQSSSPLTWFVYNSRPTNSIDYMCFEGTDLKDFRKKCIINDYNKTVLNAYVEKTDFFVTDLVYFASTNLCKIISEDEEHYFTYSAWFKDAYEQKLKHILPGKLEVVNRLKLLNDEIIEEVVDKYVKWIKAKGYCEEEVILVENKKSLCYSDGEILYYFENQDVRYKVNEFLDRIYKCFESKMPNCFVVKMPFNVYSDVHHKWGLTDLHYCREYYDYLYECYDMVANRCSQKDIDILREQYSDLLQSNRDVFVRNGFCYMNLKEQRLLSGVVGRQSTYERIAPVGIRCVNKADNSKTEVLERYYNTHKYNKKYSVVVIQDAKYLINNDECLRGYIGNGKVLDENWITINPSTVVYEKDNSIVITHTNGKSKAQMQIIKTIEDVTCFAGREVLFSVWTRCLELNDQGKGGVIGIINDNSYNKGKFYAKKTFDNREWEKINLRVRLPKMTEFKGLTLCLRALAGVDEEKMIHAKVEFSEPQIIVLVPEGEKNPKRRK